MSNENEWKVIEEFAGLSSKCYSCYSVSGQTDEKKLYKVLNSSLHGKTLRNIEKFYRPKTNRFLNERRKHAFWKTKKALLKDFPDTPPEDIKEYTGEELETYFEEMGLDGSDFRVFTETDSFW